MVTTSSPAAEVEAAFRSMDSAEGAACHPGPALQVRGGRFLSEFGNGIVSHTCSGLEWRTYVDNYCPTSFLSYNTTVLVVR